MNPPKLFISYSWSTPDHEDRVLRLATDLRENGVDVVIDKWDLREGQDAYVFMESMVTSPDVDKVLLVCDEMYARKANARAGGVGTEAQIISAEIYERKDQTKFVALVFERDAAGAPLVPTYYKSRIHIDYSDPSRHLEAFEQVLRWAHDRPLHSKPPIGQKPSFLDGTAGEPLLATSSRYRYALQALQDGRRNALAIADEFFSTFSTELEKLRIEPNDKPFDESVLESIERFLPFRNQIIQMLDALAVHRPGMESVQLIHRFLEQLLPYTDRPDGMQQWRASDFDNFRFLVHEIFLYATAILLRRNCFAELANLLDAEYYRAERAARGGTDVVPYTRFCCYVQSLEERTRRLSLGRLSLHADLLKQRSVELPVTFAQLMQADFVLYLRTQAAVPEISGRWWPFTLVYLADSTTRFELFARARSCSFFDRLKPVLAVSDVAALGAVATEFREGKRHAPKWEFDALDVPRLMGVDELCIRP